MLRRPLLLVALLAPTLVTLSGCDQLGLEAASVTAARVEADGKAVGAACRHGGRAIEDCFTLNRKTDKAAIYAGWREMDDYMRENKIEAVAPSLGADGKARSGDPVAGADADAPDASAPAATAKTAKAGEKVALPKIDKIAKPEKVAKADKPAPADADKAPAPH